MTPIQKPKFACTLSPKIQYFDYFYNVAAS